MNSKTVGKLMFVMVFACAVTGAVVYPHLPALFASHWNAAGEPNGALMKFWGVAIMPLIMLVLIGIWALLPRLDPLAKGFPGFRYVYDFAWFLIIAFFAYIYALTLGANLGWHVDMLRMILIGLSVLFFSLGSLLPYLKRNWFFGIRTPWTISSDVVWRKTHKLGAVLIQIAGLCILAGAFAPRNYVIWLIALPVAAAVLVSITYSYFVFRAQK